MNKKNLPTGCLTTQILPQWTFPMRSSLSEPSLSSEKIHVSTPMRLRYYFLKYKIIADKKIQLGTFLSVQRTILSLTIG